ncbi:MAG: RsmB/NOP family class I SAM-dependent RNA methyltransferase, partial [Acidobacteriota bacterium]
WLDRYGVEAAEQWCMFNNIAPEVTIRSAGRLSRDMLLERLTAAGLPATAAPYAPHAIRLPQGTLGRIGPELARELVVQDEGSQLVAHVVGAQPGERVLDLCASPGSKTLVLAADLELHRTPRPSLLVASDRRIGRIALLRSRLNDVALRLPLVALDALRPLPFAPVFDRVVVDVPCSGLGTIRRDPDLKWTRQESDLPGLAADAGTMLAHAAEVVRPGGRLIYATCSSEPDENGAVVDAFLARTPAFVAAPIVAGDGLPDGLVDGAGHLVTDPVRHGLEAFFAAVLVRRGAA